MHARLLVIALVLAASPALAQAPNDEAKAHFKQGKAFQDVGEYARAAEEYKAAYGLDPRPEMLFNIAQAYRLAANKEAALEYFQKYLDAQPAGRGADEARQHVAALTKELEDARRAKESQQQSEQQTTQQPPPQPVAPPQPREPEMVSVQGSSTLRIAGLATAGVGVVALGVGVKFGLDARAAADSISSHDMGAWTEADHATFDDGERANRNMIIAYSAGGALVVGGAVLYFLGARTHLVPVVSTQSASLALGGTW